MNNSKPNHRKQYRQGYLSILIMAIFLLLFFMQKAEGTASPDEEMAIRAKQGIVLGAIKPSLELKEGMEFLIEIPTLVQISASTMTLPLYPAY